MIRFLLLLILLVPVSLRLSAQVNEQDSLALVALYQSTDGDNWDNNTNWLIDDVDNWFGVSVREGRVTTLSLSANGEINGGVITSLVQFPVF